MGEGTSHMCNPSSSFPRNLSSATVRLPLTALSESRREAGTHGVNSSGNPEGRLQRESTGTMSEGPNHLCNPSSSFPRKRESTGTMSEGQKSYVQRLTKEVRRHG